MNFRHAIARWAWLEHSRTSEGPYRRSMPCEIDSGRTHPSWSRCFPPRDSNFNRLAAPSVVAEQERSTGMLNCGYDAAVHRVLHILLLAAFPTDPLTSRSTTVVPLRLSKKASLHPPRSRDGSSTALVRSGTCSLSRVRRFSHHRYRVGPSMAVAVMRSVRQVCLGLRADRRDLTRWGYIVAKNRGDGVIWADHP